MREIEIVLRSSDLASRSAGAELRGKILQAISNNDTVSIDASAVKSISHSYADEAFGVLALQVGEEQLLNHLIFVDIRDNVLLHIAAAISTRLASRPMAA